MIGTLKCSRSSRTSNRFFSWHEPTESSNAALLDFDLFSSGWSSRQWIPWWVTDASFFPHQRHSHSHPAHLLDVLSHPLVASKSAFLRARACLLRRFLISSGPLTTGWALGKGDGIIAAPCTLNDLVDCVAVLGRGMNLEVIQTFEDSRRLAPVHSYVSRRNLKCSVTPGIILEYLQWWSCSGSCLQA